LEFLKGDTYSPLHKDFANEDTHRNAFFLAKESKEEARRRRRRRRDFLDVDFFLLSTRLRDQL
jgi:hypothetical protein